MLKGVLWSAICKNNIVLSEAGEDNHDGEVIKLAQKLLQKKPTHGWEFEKCRRHSLRGMKFHVFEQSLNEGDESFIWSFCAVADKKLEDAQVRSFIEKLVYITEPFRESPEWREGDLLCAQASFAPILLQKMEQIQDQGRLAMVHQSVNTTKEIMRENIEMSLEREQNLNDLQKSSAELSVMGRQFKKRAKQVKKFKMIQNAKHGVIVGTIVTGVTAAIIVPPLVALL